MDIERKVRRDRSDWMWSGMRAHDVATAWGDWATDMADMVDSLVDAVTPRAPDRRHRLQRSDRTERCGGCARDTCHCDCCVYDADLVVYTRLHERRVVPIRITNERTRERTITLDLSDFRTSGGKPAPVHGRIATATEFTLGACEHEETIVVLDIGATASSGNVKATRVESKAKLTEDVSAMELREPLDVDDCLVAYADLRIQGCDVRPVRIAVAILPRDCEAHEVHCACGCC